MLKFVVLLCILYYGVDSTLSSKSGFWGDWGSFAYCKSNKFATGARMRSEKKQGGGDDTAGNTLRLECSDGQEIKSREGFWGDWTSKVNCPKNYYIVGFRTRVEKKQGGGDDTALNQVAFQCGTRGKWGVSPSTKNLDTLGYTSWGDWGSWDSCDDDQAVYGFRTRVEKKQGGGDDTALNSVEMKCDWVCGDSCGKNGQCDFSTHTCSCRPGFHGKYCENHYLPTVDSKSALINNQYIQEYTTGKLSCLYSVTIYGDFSDKTEVTWKVNGKTSNDPPKLPLPVGTTITCTVNPADSLPSKGTSVTSPVVVVGGYLGHNLDYGMSWGYSYDRTDNRQIFVWKGATVSQSEALRRCQELGADIVNIDKPEFNADIQSLLNINGITSAFIGLKYDTTSSTWKWTDSTNLSYYPNEFSTSPPSKDNQCVITSSSAWSQSSCTKAHSFVCSKKNMPHTTSLWGTVAVTKQLSWKDAQAQCSSDYAGNLATSLSTLDTNYLASTSWTVSSQCPTVWFGANDNNKPGTYSFPEMSLWDAQWNGKPKHHCGTLTAASSTSASWSTSDCASHLCFICDAKTLDLSPGIDRITLTRKMTAGSNLSVEIAEKTGVTLWTTVALKSFIYDFPTENVDIPNLIPGVSYYARMIKPDISTYSWDMALRVKTYCDCDYNTTSDGTPQNFVVVQEKDKNVFQYKDRSACDTVATVEQDTNTFQFTHNELQSCPTSKVTSYPNALYHMITTQTVGTNLHYCLYLSNPEKFYVTSKVCVSKSIEWIGTILGTILTKSGNIVTGVNISYSSLGNEVTGWTMNKDDGTFKIEIKSSLLTSTVQQIILNPQKKTGNVTHTYEFLTPSCQSPNCFADRGNSSGILLVSHLVDQPVTLDDLTVFSITGSVVFYNSRVNTDDKVDCPVEAATVCVTVLPYLDKSCTLTGQDGKYILTAPLMSNVIVESNFSVDGVSHTLTVPPFSCEGGTTAGGTVASCSINPISSDRRDINFAVTTTSSITFSLYGGAPECRCSLGNPAVTILSRSNPYCKFDMKTSASGSIPYTVAVPPMDYTLQLIDITDRQGDNNIALDALDYLRSILGSDLREQYAYLSTQKSTEISWEYHSRAVLSFTSIGRDPRCDGTFVVKGGPDMITTKVKFQAYEPYPSDTCYVSGSVRLWDGLIDPQGAALANGTYDDCLAKSVGCMVPLVIEDNSYRSSWGTVYTIPGKPNYLPPYTRNIKILLIKEARLDTVAEENVIVTGAYAFDDAFSNELALDGIPMLLLYKPPGDLSKSWIEKGTTLSSSLSITLSSSSTIGEELELLAGYDDSKSMCAGIGAAICSDIESTLIMAGVETTILDTKEKSTVTSLSYSITLDTTISTSDYAGLPRGYGDLVIVPSLSLRYTKTIKVLYNRTLCEVSSMDSNTWLASVSGYTMHSIYDIKNIDIPSIIDSIATEEANRDNIRESDLQDYELRLASLRQGKSMWEQILDYHERSLKVDTFSKATRLSNFNRAKCMENNYNCNNLTNNQSMAFDTIFFIGGGEMYKMETSLSNSLTINKEKNNNSLTTIGGEFQSTVSIFGLIISISSNTFGTVESLSSSLTSRGTAEQTTVGFQLGDANIGDKFNVEIWANTDFGVPLFRLLSGISSCPNEDDTLKRDLVKLMINPPYKQNVPPDQQAVFNLTLQNLSENSETRIYLLKIMETSNPGGAILTINGHHFTPTYITLEYAQIASFTMTIERGPISYSYTNIEVVALSVCEYDLANNNGLFRAPINDTATVAVDFLQPCAITEWSGNWVLDSVYYFYVNLEPVIDPKLQNGFEVVVKNPNYPNLPWAGNPRLKDVVVEYKFISDNSWSLAVIDKKNTPANVTEGSLGFGSVIVDTTNWHYDGVYEVRVRSTCKAIVGADEYNQYITSTKQGRVDRTIPTPFGQFTEPADGSYSPGDEISITMNEEVDCQLKAYAFEALIEVQDGEGNLLPYDESYLDVICKENKIQFAFGRSLSFSSLMGQDVVMYVTGIRDLGRNINKDLLSWKFYVNPIDQSILILNIEKFELSDLTLYEYIELREQGEEEKEEEEDSLKRAFTGTNQISLAKSLLCKDIATIVDTPASRCSITELYENPSTNTITISFSFTPGSPSSAILYDKFLNLVEKNSAELPSGLEFFGNNSLKRMSYVVSTNEKIADVDVNNSNLLFSIIIPVLVVKVFIVVIIIVVNRRKYKTEHK